MSWYRHATTLCLAAAACMALAACSDDDSTGITTNPTVRFVNAMTGGTSALALTTNGSAGTSVAYQQAGACQTVAPGSTTFSVGLAGSTTPLITIPTQTLSLGGHYSIVATGTAAAPQFLVLNDAYTTPASGRARLRVINEVGLTSPFDVYVGAPGASLGTSPQTNTAFNTSYNYLDVPDGATEVKFTTVGTQTVVGTSGSFTLNGSTAQTVYVTPATTVGGEYTSFRVASCQ